MAESWESESANLFLRNAAPTPQGFNTTNRKYTFLTVLPPFFLFIFFFYKI